jgi:hypothetical protein
MREFEIEMEEQAKVMQIITDRSGRVLVRTNTPSRHGYNEVWIKLIVNRNGEFLNVNKQRQPISNFKHEYITKYEGTRNEFTASLFTVK